MTLLYAIGLPLFQQLGIDAARTQLYTTVILSPYALKPFVGVASDLIAIKGYHKRYFALGSILIGLVGCVSLLCIFQNGEQQRQSRRDMIRSEDWQTLLYCVSRP